VYLLNKAGRGVLLCAQSHKETPLTPDYCKDTFPLQIDQNIFK
jgi:hypothetical protein